MAWTDSARQCLGVLLFYPSPRGGLYLKGGPGLSYVTTSISSSTAIDGVIYFNSVSESSGGFGATAGVGYDARLGRNIYIVPAIDWYLQAVGTETSSVFGTFPAPTTRSRSASAWSGTEATASRVAHSSVPRRITSATVK